MAFFIIHFFATLSISGILAPALLLTLQLNPKRGAFTDLAAEDVDLSFMIIFNDPFAET